MDLNERTNNPVIRHGLLMVKNAADKDDISNIVHDRATEMRPALKATEIIFI